MKKNSLLHVLPLAILLFSQVAFAQQPEIQYYRPWDKDGINVFEPSKKAAQPAYTGFKIRIGGSFTQDFQSLKHSNKIPVGFNPVSTTNKNNKNLLYGVDKAVTPQTDPTWANADSTSGTLTGFNLAMANLNFDFQIEDGIRVCLENYMSARHHSEFWVKGGYIQIDKLPMFKNPKWFSDYMRVKIGHFQPNFGDMQFRRSDGGNTMFNPFVENYILDAFSTEIGGEVYVFPTSNLMIMGGLTSGFINGNIDNYPDVPLTGNVEPSQKKPSVFFKAAFDDQINPNLRVRLSASYYANASSGRNTMYAGDRTGSHYFMVMEPANGASYSANFTSGRFNPGFSNKVSAFMINPFVKFYGLEVFGSYEQLKGRTNAERDGSEREFTQLSVEGNYRFFAAQNVYVGGRYVSMTGRPAGASFTKDISISRVALAAGWFPSKNLLLKGEYVMQQYKDFPTADYRNEGEFSGFMIEAVVGF